MLRLPLFGRAISKSKGESKSEESSSLTLLELHEMARAANLYLNMGRCPECHLPWPKGYVHEYCPVGYTKSKRK